MKSLSNLAASIPTSVTLAVNDKANALKVFDQDVRQLSERFPIKFFSAHGGVPDPNGLNNRDMPFHESWQRKLRWVHNGHSPHFALQFSDGGHHSPDRDPAKRDLRDFVRSFKPGKRYRVLLHPQYYSNNPVPSPRYTGTAWYDELMQQGSDAAEPHWKDVTLGCATPLKPTLRRSFFGFRLPWRPVTAERQNATNKTKRSG